LGALRQAIHAEGKTGDRRREREGERERERGALELNKRTATKGQQGRSK